MSVTTTGAAIMKKSWILAGCVPILGLHPFTAYADDAIQHCSMATLHGTYAFASTGSDAGTAFSTSGMESYDGQGNIKYTQRWHEGGVTYTYNGTGKILSITPNCVGTAMYDGNAAVVYTYFVAPDGNRFYSNHAGPNLIEDSGHEDRTSLALLVQ
jgi:hypothetical protein